MKITKRQLKRIIKEVRTSPDGVQHSEYDTKHIFSKFLVPALIEAGISHWSWSKVLRDAAKESENQISDMMR